jgi:hypothetical protein
MIQNVVSPDYLVWRKQHVKSNVKQNLGKHLGLYSTFTFVELGKLKF